MNCFPCFQNKQQAENNDNNNNNHNNDEVPIAEPKCVTTPPPPPRVDNNLRQSAPPDSNNNSSADQSAEGENSTVKVYTFRELATATKNFRQECLLGEGGFGRVFRGTLTPSGQIVAVRQLDRNGTLGNKEFQLAVSSLSQLSHPNLVKLIGYCADGEQRILVYEYVPSGSLKNHLFELQAGKKPMNWSTRMKVALGIAEGLEYLHEKADPPIIYRDLKSSNVLLDEANNARLSEYGLAKLVQSGNNKMPRVMTAYGYCAPEYERNGELTVKSDVYSFGVVLLELITGRRAFDASKPTDEQNLVSWAQPIFRDPSRFPDMADTLLRKDFPVTSLNQAIGVAAMCLQEEPQARPLISDISAALAFLVMAPPEAPIPARLLSILSSRVDSSSQFGDHNSMRLSNFSSHCKVEQTGLNSVADDEEDRESLSDDDNSGSDYEYNEDDDDDGSCSTDHEERSMIKYENGKSSKQKDSKKWGSSSSKRKSNNKSQSKGRIHSRSSSRSRSRNSNDNLKSHHDDNNYDHSSSSDEEEQKEEDGSFNRRHSHRTRSGKTSSRVTSIGTKSRNKSNKSLHSKSIGSSSSGNDSGSSRNASPRKHGHDVERSDDEREFVYSRKDSVMDSESEDDDDDGDETYHH